MDTVIEEMAEALDLNPLEFWRKIIQTPDRTMIHLDNGQPLTNPTSLQECVETMAAEIDFENKWHPAGQKTLADGRLHGIGMNCHLDRHGSTSTGRGSIIHMRDDGTALVVVGCSQHHGGPHSQAAIAAEALGITYDKIQVGDAGNADTSMNGGSQAGSASTTSNGTATYAAAMDILSQVKPVVADMLGVSAEDLDVRENKIFVKTDETKFVTWEDAMGEVDGPIIGIGKSTRQELRYPLAGFPVGTRAYFRTGVAGAYELAVDPETGEVEILSMVNVCDAGRVAERHSAEGQVKAGMWVQAGMKGTLWDVRHDPGTGILLTQTNLDDKYPTFMDLDETKNNAILLETLSAAGPFGINGIGEPAATANYAAYFMALNNALGVRILDRPCPPRKILEYLGKA